MTDWKIKILLDGDVVDDFIFDFDDDLSEARVRDIVYNYAIDNIEVEVEKA